MNYDFRSRVTKNIIKESYLALLHETKPEAITVTKLCEKACISRTTFYNHYDFIDEIADEIIVEYIDNLREVIMQCRFDTRSILKKVLTGIKNIDALHLELASHKSVIIDKKINEMIEQILGDRFQVIFGVNDNNLLKMASAYVASGINAIIRLWIASGFETDEEEVENLLMLLIFQH